MSIVLSRRGALGLAAGAVALTASSSAAAAIDDLARGVIAARQSPALSVAVMRDGELVHQLHLGTANLETNTPVNADSVYRIGSLTKQFTAAAILALAEDEALTLDDRLDRFFPTLPRGSEVTVRRTLNHTSGLGNYTDAETLHEFLQSARRDYDDAELLAIVLGREPLYVNEPGVAWAYSNWGYLLLGMIVAQASGQSYGDFVKRRLLEPAGLASIAQDRAQDVVAGRVSGYTPEATDPNGFANASFVSLTFPGGGGNLRATAADLVRWHQALLFGRVLRSDSLDAMLTPATLLDGSIAADDDPRLQRPGGYGLGIGVAPAEGPLGRTFTHTGGIQGFVSRLTTIEGSRLSVATLANCDGGFGPPTGLKPALKAIEAEALRAFA